jgi:hypothetical protein
MNVLSHIYSENRGENYVQFKLSAKVRFRKLHSCKKG